MSAIHILDQTTVDKIAAGEVVERPASVVKELTENAIDAGASRITIEIREGGISMIRITDNGRGIAPEDVRLAFLRHATSKLKSVEELRSIASLGFRGEALSSVAAVSRVELITKQEDDAAASRYVIEGGKEKLLEEVGAPDGTTIVVRDLFYNTPARAKFLKTPSTEGAHVGAFVEQLALSRPDIGFSYLVNGSTRLATTGNGSLKDALYHIYGRNVTEELLPVDYFEGPVHMTGFIAKPSIARGNRNFENYFINGRYVKSRIVSLGIESGFGNKLMQRQYPFTCLSIQVDGDKVDVNVHPTKMDVRFSDEKSVLNAVMHGVQRVLQYQEMILRTSLNPPEKPLPKERKTKYDSPAPFEREYLREQGAASAAPAAAGSASRRESRLPGERPAPAQSGGSKEDTVPGESAASPLPGKGSRLPAEGAAAVPFPHPAEADSRRASGPPASEASAAEKSPVSETPSASDISQSSGKTSAAADGRLSAEPSASQDAAPADTAAPGGKVREKYEQQSFLPPFLSPEAAPLRRIIGCAFNTYWIVEFGDKLYMIDQHAAHEKVLYCRFMREYENSAVSSQQLSPPLIISLSAEERALIEAYAEAFASCGFEIESFGGNEYKISAVPYSLSALGSRTLFTELLDHLETTTDAKKLGIYVLKVATEACKAAVKGGDRLSLPEAKALIDELFSCDDPYHCPHGRPTIITLTERDLEKRFRRIV
ncbi:MAG: DNA mismatch repair endonuclease MutL [Lachnospiraceae bacterium]|nr:DNA mismatch repair endonuclease MutL [Lachnospiraceae bacterium]